MNAKNMFWIVAGLALFIGVLTTVPDVTAKYEEPAYTVLNKAGKIEMREYSEKLIAKVHVSGTRQEAAINGFRAIADYIFGNNNAQDKIAMTVPVIQEHLPQSETFSNPQISDEAELAYENSEWEISFVMPSRYTLDTIPKPMNDQVKLEQLTDTKMVTFQFSGTNSAANLTKHKEQLDAYIAENNIAIIGKELYAFYNAPWTPPFMRRNEVMYRVSHFGSQGY
jgi:hypothetical protein